MERQIHVSGFDRERFNELTIPRMETVVQTWDGNVKFSKSNLAERLSLPVAFTKTGFARQVTAALAQVAAMGDIIDDGLAQL